MRLSTHSSDPGYQAWVALNSKRNRVRVLVDDVEQSHCITVDEELGYALVHERGPDGRFVLDGEEIKAKELYGRVQIQIKE
jgi:hypothetical protein